MDDARRRIDLSKCTSRCLLDALLLSCSFSSFISVDFIVIYGAATRSDKFSEALGWNGAVGISFLLTLSKDHTIVEGIECAGHVTERLENSVQSFVQHSQSVLISDLSVQQNYESQLPFR